MPMTVRPGIGAIRADSADMLRAMHLIVNTVNEAFEPENGAYATGGHAHTGHGHNHDHDDHGHKHSHEHAATPAATGHVHVPGCGHDH